MTRPGTAGPARGTALLTAVGRISAGFALLLCLLLQYVNHDFFPPQISVSQYGIGRYGWVFTCWAVACALAVLVLYAAGPEHRPGVAYGLATGCAGLLVMGVVRTDAGGLQHSWHAKLHTTGAIVALVALPFGMAFALDWTGTWWRRVAWSLVVLSSAALILVLLSAAGVAAPGLGAEQSWALWQAVAVTVDMALLATYTLSGFSRGRTDRPRRTGGPPPVGGR